MRTIILSAAYFILLSSSAKLSAQEVQIEEKIFDKSKVEKTDYEAQHLDKYRTEYAAYIAFGGTVSLEEFSGLNHLRNVKTPWPDRGTVDVTK